MLVKVEIKSDGEVAITGNGYQADIQITDDYERMYIQDEKLEVIGIAMRAGAGEPWKLVDDPEAEMEKRNKKVKRKRVEIFNDGKVVPASATSPTDFFAMRDGDSQNLKIFEEVCEGESVTVGIASMRDDGYYYIEGFFDESSPPHFNILTWQADFDRQFRKMEDLMKEARIEHGCIPTDDTDSIIDLADHYDNKALERWARRRFNDWFKGKNQFRTFHVVCKNNTGYDTFEINVLYLVVYETSDYYLVEDANAKEQWVLKERFEKATEPIVDLEPGFQVGVDWGVNDKEMV